MPLTYRDFTFPLNVFMHILTREEPEVRYLHYPLYASADESIAAAQEHSTELIEERLPPPPSRLLEVGIGLGTTLDRLTRKGYDIEGITPDPGQIAVIRERYGDRVRATELRFEEWPSARPSELILFQESSQYIDSAALFSQCRRLTGEVLVLDEFSTVPLPPPALHLLPEFMNQAALHRFELVEDLDLSRRAAPVIDYFLQRIPEHRDALQKDVGITEVQVEELMTSGALYKQRYAGGIYTYRLLRFVRRG